MKLISKILVMALLTITILSFSSFAGTDSHENYSSGDVGILGEICPNCDRGSLIPSTQNSPWSLNGTQRVCTHYPYGYDYQQERIVLTTYKCNYCSFSTTTSKTETQWLCKGWR